LAAIQQPAALAIVVPTYNERDRLKDLVEKIAATYAAGGIDGEIVWKEAFGFADIENRSPVTPSHRFRTGTASIVLTSAAIGLLLDEGRLKLDDEIQKYVPDFPVKQWPVTIRQVMGQVAGFRTEDPDNGVLTSSHCERPADAVAIFAKEPLLFQPGTQYCDSTFGWVLLSAVVEAAADTPFVTFLNERVIRPLGMVDTFKESVTSPPSDAATSYNPRFAAKPTFGLTPLPNSIIPATLDPTGSCPPRPTWCASAWRSTVASCCVRRRFRCCKRLSD